MPTFKVIQHRHAGKRNYRRKPYLHMIYDGRSGRPVRFTTSGVPQLHPAKFDWLDHLLHLEKGQLANPVEILVKRKDYVCIEIELSTY